MNLIRQLTPRPLTAALLTAIVAGASLLANPGAAPRNGGPSSRNVGPSFRSGEQQQPQEVGVTVKIGDATAPPRLAILDFIPLTSRPEIVEAARTIGRVFYDDIEFEREFSIVERSVVQTIPTPTSITDVAFDRWREVNVDGVALGSVRECRAGEAACPAGGIHVEVRLFGINTRQAVYTGAWEGVLRSQRLFAHRAADELHKQQRNLDGIAQTKLTFSSDRDGQRLPSTVENRTAQEIYFSDYDGESQQRVTSGLALNITPKWSPDRQALVYISFKLGLPNVFVSRIYQGLPPEQLTSNVGQNFTPVYSPDGKRIAFSSSRTGNFEIFVMNADGSTPRQLTTNTAADITPTWSPSGQQIAFTSDRTGTPQVFVMDADGLNQHKISSETGADRPTWSSGTVNEIAFAGQNGPGYDIKIYEVATGQTRQLTRGEGSNESPAFAPNGRHIAFTSTRAGKAQIFLMHRDGSGLKQITRTGNNKFPDWSQAPPIQAPQGSQGPQGR